MTPEQAREHDRLMFLADCRRARENLSRALAARRHAERTRVERWLGREPATEHPVPKRRRGTAPAFHTVNGVTRTVAQWAAHLGITTAALRSRIRSLGSLEAAIEMGGRQRSKPGVGDDFPASQGTGGGSTARDFSQLEFSK